MPVGNLQLVEDDTLLPVYFQLFYTDGTPLEFSSDPCTFNARIAGVDVSVSCDTDVDGQGSFTPSAALVARPGRWPAWFAVQRGGTTYTAPPSTFPYTLIVHPHTRSRS